MDQPSNILTHSRLGCAKNCMRKHYWRYECGIKRDRDEAPLRLGANIHAGMEQYNNTGSLEDAVRAATEPYWSDPPRFVSTDEWALEECIVTRMLCGYVWCYEGIETGEVIHCEREFNRDLVNPATGRPSRTWTHAGKIDMLRRLNDGRLAVWEYKTTSDDLSPTSDYWKRLRMDSQVSSYFSAARAQGFDPECIIYDVIRKPEIRPKLIPLTDENGKRVVLNAEGNRVFKRDGEPRESGDTAKGYVMQQRRETIEEFGERLSADMAERPDFYFARKEVPRLQSDLDEAEFDLWSMGKMLLECRNNDRWPRNTGACTQFGTCEYLDLCSSGYRNEDRLPDGYIRIDNVHPELKEIASAK